MAVKQPDPGSPLQRPTPDQRRAQSDMTILAKMWNEITDEQREAWGVTARTNRRGGLWARVRLRDSRRLFFKVNFQRLALELPPLADPPDAEDARPAPIVKLLISNHAGRVSLKLRVSAGQTQGVMVSASRPCNAGVMVCKKFTRIGPLTAPVRGIVDITRQYVAKYGIPPVGKKIFIRVQRMDDYLGLVLHTTSAIVRDEEGWEGEPKRPQNLAKT